MKESARGGTAARRGFREAMVAVEVASSLVLLVCAGLLIRSFVRVEQASPGFDASKVLTLELRLPVTPYDKPERRAPVYEAFRARIQALPGVAAVGAVDRLPFGGVQGGGYLRVVGRPPAPGTPQEMLRPSRTLPGYFESLRVPLVGGRYFTAGDTAGTTPVAIIDQATAARYFPDGQNPIGQQVTGVEPGLTATIVGVVGSVKRRDLSAAPEMSVYHAAAQRAGTAMTFTVKTTSDPLAMIAAIRRELAEVDPNLAMTRMATMEQRLSDSLARRRLALRLMMFFGLVALLLATTGLYGVLSYVVNQRRRELGIRLALGARPRQAMELVAKQGLLPVAIGIGCGLIAATAAARLLTTTLYRMSPNDPLVYASVVGLLMITAIAAIAVPARRAAKVAPVIALREE
jgi:predicted permease